MFLSQHHKYSPEELASTWFPESNGTRAMLLLWDMVPPVVPRRKMELLWGMIQRGELVPEEARGISFRTLRERNGLLNLRVGIREVQLFTVSRPRARRTARCTATLSGGWSK
jgi:hypothetical protein